jgi:tetratricopeptide (TPR) repeat protein
MMRYISKIRGRMCIRLASCVVLLLSCVSSISAQYMQQSQKCDVSTVVPQISTLVERKQYSEAAKSLDDLHACPGLSSLEMFQIGWLYGRTRRFDIALKIFKTIPQDVPDRLTHDYAIALSKFELADYRGAVDILKSRQLSGAADAKSINLLAVSYSKLGLYREAYSVLQEQIQKNSSDLSTYLNLVTVCAEGGDFAKAAEVAGQARRLFPNSPDVLIVQGAAETLLGQLDKAYDDFATGARLAPARADARFFLALNDYKQAKFTEAISTLRDAAKDGIADSDLDYLTAECLRKLDPANRDAALHELDRAIELNNNSVPARTLRGKLLLDLGRPKEALTDLEIARHEDPDSRAVVYNLARVYRALGRTREAEALFGELRAQAADTLNEFGDKRLNQTLAGGGSDSQ